MTVGAGSAAANADTAIGFTGAQVDGTGQNSTDVPHEYPDSAAQSGNSSALEDRLSGDLISRLTQSAVRIENGEYEAAQQLLNAEYIDRLALYIEVYQRTEIDDGQTAIQQQALFNETAELQIRYAQTLSEYQQVQVEYENAIEADDQYRAQQRARDLGSLGQDLRRTEESLDVRYETIESTTAGSLETASTSIGNKTDETTQQTDAVMEETYINTTMTAQAGTDGSATDPVRITGQLNASEGPPPIGTVTFLVNDRPHTGSVDSNGSFSLQYRPITEPVGSTSLEVTYVPDRSELYQGSSTDVSTTVVQDSPTVSVNDTTDTARATSPVVASGQITAGDTPVSNTSVELYTGEQQLAETSANEDGEYRFDTALPFEVETGTQTLSVRTGASETALGPANESTEITVEETQASLSLDVVRSEDSVVVSGQLLTEDGTEVGGQDVSIFVDGERRQTVQTDDGGNYEVVIDVPDGTDESESIPVGATFDGTGTTLRDASVSALVGPSGLGSISGDVLPLVGAVGAGIVLLSAGGYGLYRYRRKRGNTDGSTPPDAVAPDIASSDLERRERTTQFAPVYRHLESGDVQTAVFILYETICRELDRDATRPDTHWEFFESIANRLSDDQRSTFHELTETFESVRFKGGKPDPEAVSTLLTETRRQLVERDTGGSENTSDGGP